MSDLQSIIRRRAVSEWPDDFATQRHEIEKQTEAAHRMALYRSQLDQTNTIISTCMEKSTTEWPDDFCMQIHEFEKQLNAAEDFFHIQIQLYQAVFLSRLKFVPSQSGRVTTA